MTSCVMPATMKSWEKWLLLGLVNMSSLCVQYDDDIYIINLNGETGPEWRCGSKLTEQKRILYHLLSQFESQRDLIFFSMNELN